MKRSLLQAVRCLIVAAVALTTTSCETTQRLMGDPMMQQSMQQLLGAVTTYMIGQKGSTYYFKGKGTTQQLTLKAGGTAFQDYENTSKVADISNTITVMINNTAVTISLPDMQVGNGLLKGLVLYNLITTGEENGTKLAVSNESTIDGSFTVDGVEYKATNLYIDATVSNQKLNVKLMSIYFGEKGEQVVNLTFNGQTTTQSQQQ